MKKKIAILGSTGSIGKKTLDILRNDKKNFDIFLLTANKNTSLLIKQIKEFNPKNIIITDDKNYKIVKKKFKNKNVYDSLNKINSIYIDKTLVTMRYGGASNKNFGQIIGQNLVILNILGINRNFFKIIFFIFFKFLNRLKQFLNKTKR